MAETLTPPDAAFADPTPDAAFGWIDGLRTAGIYAIGVPHLAGWMLFFSIVGKRKKPWEYEVWGKRCARAVTRLAGLEVAVKGREFLDPDQPYVFVSNHVNLFDMFVLYQAIPRFTRSIELAEHFAWPVFGRLISAVGQIPVDPKDARVTAAGMKKAKEMLRQGHSITILPEGQRTRDGTIGPFYPGAFRLAIQAKVPVAPLVMRGGRRINHPDDWRIRPGRVEVIFGEPVPTTGLQISDVDFLAADLRQRMGGLLVSGP